MRSVIFLFNGKEGVVIFDDWRAKKAFNAQKCESGIPAVCALVGKRWSLPSIPCVLVSLDTSHSTWKRKKLKICFLVPKNGF